jgi:hypothetical protein
MSQFRNKPLAARAGSAAILLSLFVLSASAQAQSCGCTDIADIKHRIEEADVAIKTYSDEMQKMGEQMQRQHTGIPYTSERRDKLQGRVQDALSKNAHGLPTMPTMDDNPGGTDNLCNTTINLHPSATACMRESVSRHEAFHRKECLKTRSLGKIGESITSGKDRFERDGASLLQYAIEEIGGYSTEKTFLQGELSRLQAASECKPKPIEERRDYTGRSRDRTPPPPKEQNPVDQGVDSLRRRFGF